MSDSLSPDSSVREYNEISSSVAIEHAIIIAVRNMLQTGETHDEPGGDLYAKRNSERARRRAVDQLRNLGFTVTLETTAA